MRNIFDKNQLISSLESGYGLDCVPLPKILFEQTENESESVTPMVIAEEGNYLMYSKGGSPFREGGFATIFWGYNQDEKRNIVIKMANIDRCSTNTSALPDSAIYRFWKESEIMKFMRHNNILDIFDFTIARIGEKYVPVIVEEDFGGESLGMAHIDSRDLNFQLRILNGMAQAVDYIHSKNWLHCDIKPPNFICNSVTGVVKLTDFAEARPVSDTSPIKYITPGYVPYELLLENRIDRRWTKEFEKWSFTATVIATLCGELPYGKGKDRDETNLRVLEFNNLFRFSKKEFFRKKYGVTECEILDSFFHNLLHIDGVINKYDCVEIVEMITQILHGKLNSSWLLRK